MGSNNEGSSGEGTDVPTRQLSAGQRKMSMLPKQSGKCSRLCFVLDASLTGWSQDVSLASVLTLFCAELKYLSEDASEWPVLQVSETDLEKFKCF